MHALESSEKGAYTDNIRFIQYLDGNTALRDIKAGNLDTYLFRIPLETVASISNDTNVKIYEKNAGSFSFLLNPAPAKNPNISINKHTKLRLRPARMLCCECNTNISTNLD